MAAIIDTSAVLAAVDRSDPAHAQVVAAIALERSTIALPIVVLPEVAFLLERRHGAARAAAVVDRIVRGPWPVTGPGAGRPPAGGRVGGPLRGARIGFVDTAIAALAERLAMVRVYTLDRRDFAVLRPRHVPAFEVLPTA